MTNTDIHDAENYEVMATTQKTLTDDFSRQTPVLEDMMSLYSWILSIDMLHEVSGSKQHRDCSDLLCDKAHAYEQSRIQW